MAYSKEKVAIAALSAKPFVERALRDEELRENILNAYASARAVYAELGSRKRVSDAATQLANDKDVQDDLRRAVEELRNAANRVQRVKQQADDSGRAARNTLLLLTGIALGILFNPVTGPSARKLVARRLFGGGNDFVYQGNGTQS
jgi:hypothetical protein